MPCTKVANLIRMKYLIYNGNNIIFYFQMSVPYNPHPTACWISCLCLPFLHNFFRSLIHAVLDYKTLPSHADLLTSAKPYCIFNHCSCFPKALDALPLSYNTHHLQFQCSNNYKDADISTRRVVIFLLFHY